MNRMLIAEADSLDQLAGQLSQVEAELTTEPAAAGLLCTMWHMAPTVRRDTDGTPTDGFEPGSSSSPPARTTLSNTSTAPCCAVSARSRCTKRGACSPRPCR